MLRNYLLLLLTFTTLLSCNKSEEPEIPCRTTTIGEGYERKIPDSVSIDSNIVIGVQWKRNNKCEHFFDFYVDTIENNTIRIILNTVTDTCNCIPDTAKYEWQYYTCKPDTIGRYPIKVSAFYAAFFVDTIVVY
jgi:hypothetical protein